MIQRWSPRAFKSTPVEPAKLHAVFEAARWSASSYNEQPWRFLIATSDNRAAYDKALGCLVEANQAWAKTAPVLVLTVVSDTFIRNGKPNRCAEHDLGLAMGNLSIQAAALGLMVHQMAGVELDRVKLGYGIPDGFRPFSAFVIGYADAPESLPTGWMRDAEVAPRDRKPFSEFIFEDTFGNASKLF